VRVVIFSSPGQLRSVLFCRLPFKAQWFGRGDLSIVAQAISILQVYPVDLYALTNLDNVYTLTNIQHNQQHADKIGLRCFVTQPTH
jgi:hypothetical protein